MYFKIKTFPVTAAALVAGMLLCGCGKDAPNTPLADGLKEISINSAQIFQGDAAALPGYDYRSQAYGTEPTGAGKAAAQISFDRAYAMVIYCLASNMIIPYPSNCEVAQDLYRAYGDLTPRHTWENIVAGARALSLKEIINVTELQKSGDFVEGSIYVKPGWNDVVIFFVKGDSVIWTSENTYLNFDGWDCAECDMYYEAGWHYTDWWARTFYLWEAPYLGDLEVTESSVNSLCGTTQPINNPPSAYLSSPLDGATGQDPANTYLYWYGDDPDFDPVTYTLYIGTTYPPTTAYLSNTTATDYYATTLSPATTYYWYVVASDGRATGQSAIYSFTTQ